MVDHGRMLDLLGSEGQLLTAATHDAHEDLPVSGASGRTLGQSVGHLGDLCEDALSWMGASESAARNWGPPRQPGLRELTGRFTARLADLLAEFGTRSPQERCATWWPHDHTVGFWLRRILHATTVHRVDVQTAAGVEMTPIDPALALDGIDEVLRLWFGYRLRALGITATRPCSVVVKAGGRSWRASATPEGIEVWSPTDEPSAPVTGAGRPGTAVGPGGVLGGFGAKGSDGCGGSVDSEVSAVLSGEPPAVYLWLWGRLPDRAVTADGDPDAIAQLWGLLRLATR
ncbi:maleylpyruvate isomerase N-terminal domain-containing protein [Saccharopolyspora erythraea]|uniref:maleylpyruvate isomerase N-terminal domain-containing protein n=1 Tax=Saccharopolyspora erythraea TaxID=1836 RepID=UPI00201331C6|nr:maleylpyruvate isomerase N-terminal domain-containing protein [Saccharopolyspora erythraea]